MSVRNAWGHIVRHQEGAVMSLFTAEEIAYLHGQRLGRLATANTHGELHVTPVGFAYNAELDTIDIGGRGGGVCARSTNFAPHPSARAGLSGGELLAPPACAMLARHSPRR